MAKYLLKKSYHRKNLKEINFQDLWNKKGVFTTMYVYGKPAKILFLKSHINNLIKSLKFYNLFEKNLKSKIIYIIKKNLSKKKRYNNLLRIALDKNLISISIRKKIKPSKNFSLKLVNYKRIQPEHKNLNYKFILSKLSKIDTQKYDILLTVNNKVLETGTSNVLFVKNRKIYSPKNKFYRGNNLKFFQKKFKIIKKDILIKDLKFYEEILIMGSGKDIVSISSISGNIWKRKNKIIYLKLLRTFNFEIKKKIYTFKL